MKIIHAFFVVMLCAAVPASALETISTLGNGNDSDPQTFHFSEYNMDFQMTRSDGTPLSPTDVPLVYGIDFMIRQNDGKDYIDARGLTVVGADLSGSQWTNSSYPGPNYCAIDPATGRIKFAAAQWGGAHRIDRDPTLDSYHGIIKINNQGDAVIAYKEVVSGMICYFYARHYSPDTGWGSVVTLQSQDVDYHDLGLAENGQAMTVYNLPLTPDRIYAQRYVPGIGWETGEYLEDGSLSTWLAPLLAMNDGGDVICSVDGFPSSYHIFGNAYTPGVGWTPLLQVDSQVATASSYSDSVAINNQGDGIIAFRQAPFASGDYPIWVRHYLPGSGWQEPVRIAHLLDGMLDDPAVALNDMGQAVCTFMATISSDEHRIYACHFQAGTGWQPMRLIYTSTATISSSYFDTQLVMNESGEAICSFQDEISGRIRAVMLNYSPDAGWSGPHFIDEPSQGDAALPALTLDNQGVGIGLFSQANANGICGRMYASIYYPQDGWQSPVIVDASNNSLVSCSVDINQYGKAVCAFSQYDGTYYRLYANFIENTIPGHVQGTYFAPPTPAPTVATPAPSRPGVQIANRKLEPLRGETTRIDYQVSETGLVSITLYDMKGKKVASLVHQVMAPGSYSIIWNGQNEQTDYVASGIYILKLKMPGLHENYKIAVIK